MKILISLLLVSQLLFGFSNYEPKKKLQKDDENTSKLEQTLNNIEEHLFTAYNKLNDTSKYIDGFFLDNNSSHIYDNTYLRVEYSLFDEEDEDLDHDVNVDFRLQLPQLKEKLSLVITNNFDRKDDEYYEDSTEDFENENNDFALGFLYDSINKYINYKTRVGIKTSSGIFPFVNLELNKLVKFNQKNYILLKNETEYSNEEDLNNIVSAEYIKKLNSRYSFYIYNSHEINNEKQVDEFENTLRFLNQISNKRYVNYVFSIDSNNDKSNLKIKSYDTYISYRNYVRKWLYYDLVPSVDFKEKYDFDSNFGFRVNLGIVIGK